MTRTVDDEKAALLLPAQFSEPPLDPIMKEITQLFDGEVFQVQNVRVSNSKAVAYMSGTFGVLVCGRQITECPILFWEELSH